MIFLEGYERRFPVEEESSTNPSTTQKFSLWKVVVTQSVKCAVLKLLPNLSF
jgi:hypothetical protein